MDNIITVNIENLVERLQPQDYFTFVYLNKEDSFENTICQVKKYLYEKVKNECGMVVLGVSYFPYIEFFPEVLEKNGYSIVTKWKHSNPLTTFLDEVSYSRRFQIVFDENLGDVSLRCDFENNFYKWVLG